MLTLLQTALELGLISALTVLALFLSYSMLNVCDLSTDGCFTLGATVGATVAISGHPYLSIPAAMLAGVLSGFVTAILQTKMGVNSLLAGIIVNTALYSVNIAVMGNSSLLNMNRTETVFTVLRDALKETAFADTYRLIIAAAAVLLVGLFLAFFLKTRLGLAIGIRGLFNIQFIVDRQDQVFIIEVNPRASRSVPFLSKSTGLSLVNIATKVMMGENLASQGITEMIPKEKERWYVKAPAFSFEKLSGMDAYLSPEMKSTGEAIGYDKRLNRAFYKALQASGIRMKDYGTVVVTLADEDKEEALPLIRRFYMLGFNIEATIGTANFLKEHGIRTRVRGKLSEGSDEILKSIRAGYVSYIINTRAILSGVHYEDGVAIRRCAVQNGVTMFTSLDTVKILLDVLEETVPEISTIDGGTPW